MYDFGQMDDLLDERGGQRTAARWVAIGLGAVFLGLSALTTAGFFFYYAAGLGDMFGPAIGPYIAALIGVVALDIACLLWSYVRAHGTSSQAQQVMSGIVGAVDLVMSLVVSALYVVLSGSSLAAGVYAADGVTLTSFGQALHLAGVVIITSSLVINFAAVWLFSAMSADTRAAAQRSELAAAQREASFRIQAMHTRAAVNSTLQSIAERVPDVSQATAQYNAARYVERMRPVAGELVEHEPVPSTNGSGPRPTQGRA
jgi:hypothetical protein